MSESCDAQDNDAARSYNLGIDWEVLVDGVRKGDAAAMEKLYGVFTRGLRFYICRRLGAQDLDDRVHDAFVVVVEAIQRGLLREPGRLMGFVRTVVNRQIAGHIDEAVHKRKEEVDLEIGARVADGRINPEGIVSNRECAELMKRVLGSLSARDREILTRFYLHEQPIEQICREMSLSETQFRLMKSRAKARFGELGKRTMRQQPCDPILAVPPSPLFNEREVERETRCLGRRHASNGIPIVKSALCAVTA